MLAEAGSASFKFKGNSFLVLAFNGAAEEEIPGEKDNLNTDKQFSDCYNSYYNFYMQIQNYSLAGNNNLPFIFQSVFSPPPNS